MAKRDPIRLVLNLSSKPDMRYWFTMNREVSGFKSTFFFTEREIEAFAQSVVDLVSSRNRLFEGHTMQVVEYIDEPNQLD